MSFIRDEEEACLVELHAQGAELVERYRELLEDDVPSPAVAEILRDLVHGRRRCLEALARRLEAREAMPRAGDPDRAFVQALADALGADTSALIDRLMAAESAWADTLDRARKASGESGGSDDDRQVLDRLGRHIDEYRERLQAAAG